MGVAQAEEDAAGVGRVLEGAVQDLQLGDALAGVPLDPGDEAAGVVGEARRHPAVALPEEGEETAVLDLDSHRKKRGR